jgi:hypothetical protein
MTPAAGRKLPGRSCVGPAWPRIPCGPSIAVASASMTTTAGTSAVMTRDQRSAAVVKAARWALVSPPLKRTSMT